MRRFAAVSVFALAVAAAVPALAQDGVVSGTGAAAVTRDANATRAAAEAAARADLIRSLAREILGAERMGELSSDVILRIANQIRPEMIVDYSSQRVGREFRTTVSARVDRSWVIARLDDEGIQSSSRRGGGERQRILVMLDEVVGAARDLQAPAEVVTEYSRDSGAQYSDTSRMALSERERAGQSSSYAAGSSASGSSASGYSDGYGSGASRASGSRSSAARGSSSAAYSSSRDLAVANNVQASAHDNVRFSQRITYQTTASTAAGRAAVAALTGELINYDIATSNAVPAMADFAPGMQPLYADLQESGRLRDFMTHVSRNAPFFMGGHFSIRDNGVNPATGQPSCTGEIAAQAYASASYEDIGSTTKSGAASAASYELCASQLAESLSKQAAETLGPQIQRFWRNQTRARAGAVQAATGTTDYTLTVRGASDLAMQADILDVLSAIPGISGSAFLEQSGDQMTFQVRYTGSTPLHLALYQRMRANARFAEMKAEAAPQSVLICLSGTC